MCAALRTIPATFISLDGWVRVTDWRRSLTPLSPLGRIKGLGAASISVMIWIELGDRYSLVCTSSVSRLYLAHDFDAAYREYFGTGNGLVSSVEPMTPETGMMYLRLSIRGRVVHWSLFQN